LPYVKSVGLDLLSAESRKAHHAGETKRYYLNSEFDPMAKKSRGGRMTAAKTRAAKSAGGKGLIKNRPAGRNIMKT